MVTPTILSHLPPCYYTLPEEWRALRGHGIASVSGDSFYTASLEYRMPLLWIDRGYNTLPVFFRYLSGAAFIDAGNAFDSFADSPAPLVGIGAELRASMVV